MNAICAPINSLIYAVCQQFIFVKKINPVSLDTLLLSSVSPVTLDKCYFHYILCLDLNFWFKKYNKILDICDRDLNDFSQIMYFHFK